MKVIASLLCLFLLSGCSSPQTPAGDFYVLPHAEDVELDRWSQYVDSFQLIPLETTPQSLIGRINKIEYVDGIFYVLSDHSRLTAFNSDGSFIRNFGKTGDGPEELDSFTDFDVYGGHVYLAGYDKLLRYDVSGILEGTSALKFPPSAIKKTGDGMLYYLSTPVGEDCLAYSGDSGSWVTALKKNETLRLNRPVSWIGWTDGSYIFPEGNSADIALFTESSMSFHDARITPAADALSLEENERIKKEKGDRGVLESGKTIYDGMTRSGSQLLLWEARKGDLYMYLHDFEDETARRFIPKDIDDDLTYTKGLFLQNTFRCISNERQMVSYLDEDILKEVFQDHEDNKYYGPIMKLPEESNPVIVLFHLGIKK